MNLNCVVSLQNCHKTVIESCDSSKFATVKKCFFDNRLAAF
jgi:hypothetical protein